MNKHLMTFPSIFRTSGMLYLQTLIRDFNRNLTYKNDLENKIASKEKQIIVIDDDPLIGISIKTALPQYDFLLALSGKSGINLFMKNKQIDLILLDYQMYDLNGLETLIELRKICKKTNIIVITGNDNHNFVRQALEKGANGFLFKPFNLESLKKIIDSC